MQRENFLVRVGIEAKKDVTFEEDLVLFQIADNLELAIELMKKQINNLITGIKGKQQLVDKIKKALKRTEKVLFSNEMVDLYYSFNIGDFTGTFEISKLEESRDNGYASYRYRLD